MLLCTALIRSLARAYPQAAIDALTLEPSAAALEGNPDIRRVLTLPARAGAGVALRTIGGWRAYDLAVSTLIDDRPQLLAFCAARQRANIVPQPGTHGAIWKRALAQRQTDVRVPAIHMVEQYLRLADALGIARDSHVVPPRPQNLETITRHLGAGWQSMKYAVVHPMPLYAYKAWTVDGWTQLISGLRARGMQVVLTGGHAQEERDYVHALAQACGQPVINLCAALKFSELTPLIEHARIFVGPDTSVTHLAAATGVRTIALFGPSPPVNWGPWPQGYAASRDSPWIMVSPLQRQGNVSILQGITPCVPCQGEGCERHRNSRSVCLDEMPASRVLVAIDTALARS